MRLITGQFCDVKTICLNNKNDSPVVCHPVSVPPGIGVVGRGVVPNGLEESNKNLRQVCNICNSKSSFAISSNQETTWHGSHEICRVRLNPGLPTDR